MYLAGDQPANKLLCLQNHRQVAFFSSNTDIATTRPKGKMGMARSLNDAARLASRTTSLILRASEDLVCRNLMCAKVGGACVCRLALCVSRLSDLRELDVADNDLGVLPDSLFELARLERLDISGEGLVRAVYPLHYAYVRYTVCRLVLNGCVGGVGVLAFLIGVIVLLQSFRCSTSNAVFAALSFPAGLRINPCSPV